MSSDPQDADPQQQEQMREYVEQLRAADPAEIVAQAFTMLGTGAEVKLGDPGARVLIDAVSGMVSAIEGKVPAQLLDGMRSGVAQLQQAQVQAESQAGTADTRSAAGQPGGGAAPQRGAGGPAAGGPGGGSGGEDDAEDKRMTDRLWIPGRDAPPPAR